MNWRILAGFAVALAFVLLLNGAVPFVAMPTIHQAVWTTGFSQSFVNESIFSIYAGNFGIPVPAPISFGLAGAYPAGLLIAAGLHPSDAYSMMAALWLSVAFFGAWRFASMAGLAPWTALLSSLLWMSMPVVWAHADYSMLSFGIALMPFYFWATLRFFLGAGTTAMAHAAAMAFYFAACLIAVFMDGYSFMMFAVGSSVLIAYFFVTCSEKRRRILSHSLPVHVLGLGTAYFLYSVYVGKTWFDPSSMDFFRGWGLDLSFLVIPTKGMHWMPDLMGWSIARSETTFFGDKSVWETTFSVPILLAGAWGWWSAGSRKKTATAFLLVAAIGFYLSLGPSLKINCTRPEGASMSPVMPAEYALAPTGTVWISKYVPGFSNMRACYRWAALGVFGCWVLTVILLSSGSRKKRWFAAVVAGLILLFNLPDLEAQLKRSAGYRDMFHKIDAELVADFRGSVRAGETVAFLPYQNDFLVNYLASRLGIRTYNIGGDKNLTAARMHWPETMRHFGMGRIDAGFSNRVKRLLVKGEADVVVLPYVNLFWHPSSWPIQNRFQEALVPEIDRLKKNLFLAIDEKKYYATVRIVPENPKTVLYPINVIDHPLPLLRALGEGWHDLEQGHVWSKSKAELILPVPGDCRSSDCTVTIEFSVFGASEKRPVAIWFTYDTDIGRAEKVFTATDGGMTGIDIPLPGNREKQNIHVNVPQAVSPRALNVSSDPRVLGIALQAVKLSRQGMTGTENKNQAGEQ